jgi:predicted lipid-binding transport protein (Tim44 family)
MEMANSQLLLIVLAAMVAGVFAIRLYTVLGRRTGAEREPSGLFGRMAGAAAAPARPAIAAATDPLSRALTDIKLADKSFDNDKFLSGARHAYEIVVTAFAQNDRAAMRPLVNDEVFAVFDKEMHAREERGEKTSFTFGGFTGVKIAQAFLKDRMAEITVAFAAQFASATMDAAGKVIEGDAKAMRDVVDHWSFARDVRASDPNWTLVATAGPEAI